MSSRKMTLIRPIVYCLPGMLLILPQYFLLANNLIFTQLTVFQYFLFCKNLQRIYIYIKGLAKDKKITYDYLESLFKLGIIMRCC